MTGPAIRPGEFRHSALLQAPTVTLDTHGGRATTFSTIAQIRCKVEATGGGESMAGNQPVANRSSMVTTWYRTDITTRMRLVIGDRTLEVVSISDPTGMQRILQLMCVEIV